MTRAAFLGVFWLGCVSGRAQAPVNTHTLGMDVAITASGGAGDASTKLSVKPGGIPLGGGWHTVEQREYTQHHEQDSALGLEVQVRNVGHTGDSAKLEWYFFSKEIKGDKPDELFDSGSENVSLTGGTAGKYSIRSESVHSSVTRKYNPGGGVSNGRPVLPKATVHKSGARVSGWIVRLVADGKPLVVKASAPSLEAMGVSRPVIR